MRRIHILLAASLLLLIGTAYGQYYPPSPWQYGTWFYWYPGSWGYPAQYGNWYNWGQNFYNWGMAGYPGGYW